MTNYHATVVIPFCKKKKKKKKGSSQLMVSEQLTLRVIRKVKYRVMLKSKGNKRDLGF
jgi:hypothetical protein